MSNTLQTTAPLPNLAITGGSNSGTSANWLASEEDFDTDQPYQRGLVWGTTRQRLLIKSLIMHLPIPAIMINERHSAGFSHYGDARDAAFAVVDGKQRVHALRSFFSDALSVPASWFAAEDVIETVSTEDGDYVLFTGLARPRQMDLRMTSIALVRAKLSTLEAEAEAFDLLNFGGVAQGESDLD